MSPGPASEFQHTGRADCCVACSADRLFSWIDERAAARARIRAERGLDLSSTWIDLGGEA